jgi:hypothetical protein
LGIQNVRTGAVPYNGQLQQQIRDVVLSNPLRAGNIWKALTDGKSLA